MQAELARTYGRRTTVPASPSPPPIWTHGSADRDVPPCVSCHGATARSDFPRLIGQYQLYLIRQLTLFTTIGSARGGPHASIMADAAHNLTPEQIRTVSAWLSGAISW